MGKKAEQATLDQDFKFEKDADLNAQITAFASAHEAANNQILAMDSRRSLGPGKVRVTFRILPKKRPRPERA